MLHAVVRDHLESFLEDARQRSAHGFGVPRHVERELRNYLACGVLAVVWEELASRLDRGGSNAFDPSITVDAAGGRSWSGTTIRRAWPTWRPGWTNP